MTTKNKDMTEILSKLESEEQIESLQYLVEKLPTFVSSLQAAEDKLSFVMESLQDRQTLKTIATETEEKIDRLHIDETHMNAMLDLVHLLPRLAPVVQQLDDVVSFVESVAGDERTINQFIKSSSETINSYVPIDKGKEIFEETNEQFERTKNSAPISIFGLMKMLKDPVVQDGLKYTEALLTVLNKHRK